MRSLHVVVLYELTNHMPQRIFAEQGSAAARARELTQRSKRARVFATLGKYCGRWDAIANELAAASAAESGHKAELMTNASASIAPVVQPAPTRVRTANDSSPGFSAIAALGAAFAGFLSYGQNPDLLSTAVAAGLMFVGALLGLHVLRFLFRLAVGVAKIAIPVVVLLLIGSALDWPVAESASRWLSAAGHQGVELAARGWTALQAREMGRPFSPQPSPVAPERQPPERVTAPPGHPARSGH